jgi:hypothetical protein
MGVSREIGARGVEPMGALPLFQSWQDGMLAGSGDAPEHSGNSTGRPFKHPTTRQNYYQWELPSRCCCLVNWRGVKDAPACWKAEPHPWIYQLPTLRWQCGMHGIAERPRFATTQPTGWELHQGGRLQWQSRSSASGLGDSGCASSSWVGNCTCVTRGDTRTFISTTWQTTGPTQDAQ